MCRVTHRTLFFVFVVEFPLNFLVNENLLDVAFFSKEKVAPMDIFT